MVKNIVLSNIFCITFNNLIKLLKSFWNDGLYEVKMIQPPKCQHFISRTTFSFCNFLQLKEHILKELQS